MRGFKKGFAIVVPGARRSGMKEGKQGFVEIGVESVKVCNRFKQKRGRLIEEWVDYSC